MDDKPSYLSLLNAIAVGELGGELLLKEWAAATPDDNVRAVMQTIALREGEHAKSFAKRIDELGFTVVPKDDPALEDRCKIAASTSLSDCEKFDRLGFNRAPTDTDIFSTFFEDISMDVKTGELMGRYVAEERDSGRMLRSCYDAISAQNGTSNGSAIEDRLERIECALAELAAATATSAAAPKAKAKK